MTNDIAKPNKTLFRVLLAAVAVLLLCSVFCGAAAANDTPEPTVTDIYDEATLREAVVDPNFNVRLCADIKLTNFRMGGKNNSLVIPNAGIQDHRGTIDLNGHSLIYAGVHSSVKGDNNGSVIILKPGTTLTIKDSSAAKTENSSSGESEEITTGTGKITGGSGTHPLMNYGESYLFGGGVYVSDGAHLILESGSISDNRIYNRSKIDAAGAGVYADGYGTFEMKGGSITNNYASAINGYAAGVHIRRGTFTMSGGIISGNIAVSQNNSVGGGVYLWGNARFEMTGGIISGNSANRGGGVYVNSSIRFSVKGDASIMNNSKDDVALIDPHFRTIPKGMLDLIGELKGTVLVVLDDRYRGPAFGDGKGGSEEDAKHIINEKDGKYAVKNKNDELEWGTAAFPGTLITLKWDDKDEFYGEKIGHVAAFKDQTTSFPIIPISKQGYSFTGWDLPGQASTTPLIGVDGKLAKGVKIGETEYTDETGKWIYSGATLTLYAVWNHDGTTLYLDGNGGSPASQTVKVKYDSTTVDCVIPSRSDSQTSIPYEFRGWFLDRGCTTLLIDKDKKLVPNVTVGGTRYTDADGGWVYGKTTYDKTTLTLYAGWYADGTQLTLDGQGGEPAKQIVSVATGKKEVRDIALSVDKDGYPCTGWYLKGTGDPVKLINRDGTLVRGVKIGDTEYTDAEGKWVYNDTTTPTLTLYADWRTDVTYYKENTIYDERSYQHGQVIHQSGEGMDIPKAPEPVDSFIGWRVGKNGPFIFFYQEAKYQLLLPSPHFDSNYKWTAKADTLKLYAAIWNANGVEIGDGQVPTQLHTVTYDANKADSGRVPKETEWYAPGDKVTVCGNTGDLEKYGYTFNGWNTQEDGMGITYKEGDKITIGEDDITLYAQWRINQYTITFDSDGGSYVAPITQAYGTPVTAPANPTSDGYTFQYWIRWGHEEGSEGEWITGVPTTMPGMDITCYAIWKLDEWEYNPQGGEDKVVIPEGEGKTVPEHPDDPIVKVTRVDGVQSKVTFSKTSDMLSPTDSTTGFRLVKVLTKFEITTNTTENTKIIIGIQDTGLDWQYIFLRHCSDFNWDNTHIKGEYLGKDGDFLMLAFPITSCSPFAVVYETPVKSSGSSSPQGSSTWLTETPTPTATPTPTPSVTPTPEVPTVKPIASETKPAASPVPFASILAGLGAAAVLLTARMRR